MGDNSSETELCSFHNSLPLIALYQCTCMKFKQIISNNLKLFSGHECDGQCGNCMLGENKKLIAVQTLARTTSKYLVSFLKF